MPLNTRAIGNSAEMKDHGRAKVELFERAPWIKNEFLGEGIEWEFGGVFCPAVGHSILADSGSHRSCLLNSPSESCFDSEPLRCPELTESWQIIEKTQKSEASGVLKPESGLLKVRKSLR
jgi:hypothetical protein